MKFNKEILQELEYIYPGEKLDGIEVVESKLIDTGRWTENWTQVLKFDDRFYRTNFKLPATEMQEGMDDTYDNLEDENGMVDVVEVFPFEEIVTVYKEKMDVGRT